MSSQGRFCPHRVDLDSARSGRQLASPAVGIAARLPPWLGLIALGRSPGSPGYGSTPKPQHLLVDPSPRRSPRPLHRPGVYVAISPDGRNLATADGELLDGSDENTVRLWDPATDNQREFPGRRRRAWSLRGCHHEGLWSSVVVCGR